MRARKVISNDVTDCWVCYGHSEGRAGGSGPPPDSDCHAVHGCHCRQSAAAAVQRLVFNLNLKFSASGCHGAAGRGWDGLVQSKLRTSSSPAFSSKIAPLLFCGAVVPLFKFCPGLTSLRFDRYSPALKTTNIGPLFSDGPKKPPRPRPVRPAPPPPPPPPCQCLTSSTFSWRVSKSLTPKNQSPCY